MKVKLYHKFVEDARKHAFNKEYSRKWLFSNDTGLFVYNPPKNITGYKDDDILLCIYNNTFLHRVWKDFKWCEIWRKKYKKYSRKYWTSKAKLTRAIKGEED